LVRDHAPLDPDVNVQVEHARILARRAADLVGLVLALLALNVTSAARGEELNPLNDQLSLSIGAFLLTTNTTVRVDGSCRSASVPSF
jgi:hypothetical protein